MAHPTITIGLLPLVDELVDWQRQLTVASIFLRSSLQASRVWRNSWQNWASTRWVKAGYACATWARLTQRFLSSLSPEP